MKKYLSSKTFIILIFLGALYLFTRLYHLLLLPIFTDESIYIFWAREVATTHSQWFVSLGDGKPPLLIWAIAVFLKLLPTAWYLLAGRLPAVLAGFVSFSVLYFLTKDFLGSQKAGFIAAFLYITLPFFLVYDKMALFDSPLSSMLLVSVYFAYKASQTLKAKDAILWGFFLGLAFLFKPTAIVYAFLTPLVMLLQDKKTICKNSKRMIFLSALAIGISEVLNNSLRVSHIYNQMAIKNAQFQVPLSVVIKNPFALVPNNLQILFSWLIPYVTLPLFIVSFLGLLLLFKNSWKKAIFLFLLCFAPIYAFATVGKELFPRYILFTSPYLLIAGAYLLDFFLSQRYYLSLFGYVLLAICIFLPLRFDYYLLTNPARAPLPSSDYNQYIAQHPSGYGLAKIFAYLDGQVRKTHNVTIATQGTFGLYPYAFELYYWNDSRVHIIPHYPLHDIDYDIVEAEKKSNVFIVFKDYAVLPPELPVKIVVKAEKPGGQSPIYLTKLTKKP